MTDPPNGVRGGPDAAGLLSGIPLVDAHHHFWELGRFPYSWLSPGAPPARFGDKAAIRQDYLPPDYLAEMKGLPLVASVHVQANCGAADPAEETRWLQELSDRTGWPMAVVAEADLADAGSADLLRRHSAFPVLRGVRTPVAWDAEGRWRIARRPDVLSDSGLNDLAGQLADQDLCLEMVVVPAQLPAVTRFALRHPSLRIVIDHFATLEPSRSGNRSEWMSGISDLADAPNVHVKLSGLWTADRDWAPEVLGPCVSHLIDEVGARRVLYGSNLPVERVNCPVGRQFEQLATILASRPKEDLRDIFCDTACQVYRLNIGSGSR